ncbi:MAG: hypothetical protein IJ799_02685, partial [Bacteroidales bacterium]|nr:hypothetical protein [Bacteroidales bacterium]
MEKRSFPQQEQACSFAFDSSGPYWHLYTPEMEEILFTCAEDFRWAMAAIAVCALLCPDVVVITFQIMSNHLHFALSGTLEACLRFFGLFKKALRRWVAARSPGRMLRSFDAKLKPVTDLTALRAVIIYINRNGFVVSADHSPFSYPWGANRFYFNPEAKERHRSAPVETLTLRERRELLHSHCADSLAGVRLVDGTVSPVCFCAIDFGEGLFRNASHYFHQVSRQIESYKAIAREIGESVFYTDDELYAAVRSSSRQRFGE